MKHIIEYRPQISEECQTYIGNNINFVYSGEDTDIYALDYVYETLSEEVDQNGGEEIFGISLQDIAILKSLIDEKVDYIEF
jgi:hypothetical protein